LVTVAVKAGASSPQTVSEDFIDALDTVTVRQADDGPSTFQLLLDAERAPDAAAEFPVISDATVVPGNRVKIALSMFGTTQPLMDGVVVHQELNYESSSDAFSYSVIGEDVSIYLRLEAKAAEWPARSSAQIVREILGNYSQYVTPTVVAPSNDYTPTADQWVRQQNSTDLSFLRTLGRPFGHVFSTRPGATIDALSTAYWGPPPRSASPLPALTVGMGPDSNVLAIDFGYDAAAAEVYAGGSRVDAETFAASPIPASSSFGLDKFATTGSLDSTLKRTRRFVEPNLAGTLAKAYADALAQVSSRTAARARAVVDGLDYGTAVTPASVIAVRGAGKAHDGLYYVERVEHTLRRGSYRQEIVMTREGLGATISKAS
jgi:phage protein D